MNLSIKLILCLCVVDCIEFFVYMNGHVPQFHCPHLVMS